MPILLKTRVKRTAKTLIPARRARVGGMCGFRSTAERVPIQQQKSGRCAAARERCKSGKHGRRSPVGGFRQREKLQAAKQEKGLALFCASPSTSAHSARSFGG